MDRRTGRMSGALIPVPTRFACCQSANAALKTSNVMMMPTQLSLPEDAVSAATTAASIAGSDNPPATAGQAKPTTTSAAIKLFI